MTHTGLSGTRLVSTTQTVARIDNIFEYLGADGFAWISDDTSIITSGVASRVGVADVQTTLNEINGDEAIACGALPFTDARSATLVIPARVVRQNRTETTITTIEGAAIGTAHRYAQTPLRFTVEALQDLTAWDAIVASALALIDDGAVDKIVLAREVLITADHDFNVPEVITTLHRTQPGCFIYANCGFVGASPELLVRRTGRHVVSKPMAGTVARQASIEADDATIAALRASMKDNAEHRYVVEAVVGALANHCDNIEISDALPVLLATVSHLTTSITATLTDSSSALDLALALHPTPAVGGTPTAAALQAITALEPFDRRSYAGPVGWVDRNGNGEFAVALRCAELQGNTARLVAGVGIVDGSDPDLEWAETQAKLEPMLRALVRP